MRTSSLLRLLALSGLSNACGHDHHDEKEWTKEELADLEAKWGFEVGHPKLNTPDHLLTS